MPSPAKPSSDTSFIRVGRYAACAAIAAAVFAPTIYGGDDDETKSSHRAHVIVKTSGNSDSFMVDGDDLEIGESRQFFTEDGEEVVVLRTESGFEISVDGEDVLNGDSGVNVVEVDEQSTHIEVLERGEQDVKIRVMRLHTGESNVEIDDADGRRLVFIGSGDGSDDTKVIRVDSGKAFAFATGDSKTALEHLTDSGALDKLDAETRAKVIEALEDITGDGQNP
ncbi:MAG: hypothetical protein AAGM22_09525 [Acidobacteriota bacterium]